MLLEQAQNIARQLVTDMAPFCQRVEIAGSIRRQVPEVKDVEIVAVPRWEVAGGTLALFGDADEEGAPRANVLYTDWALDSGIRWIKTGTSEIIDWRIDPNGQYWRGLLPSGLKLDLFLATPESWGIDLVIRTGSAEFSKAVVTHAKRIARPCVRGSLTLAGLPHPTPEEKDVFAFLNLDWVAPEQRTGWSALRSRLEAARG